MQAIRRVLSAGKRLALGPRARPWRDKVGGNWEELGRLQFNYMLAQGLHPRHSFLDVGCGCLRAGVHFIAYLQDGRYFGIDRDQSLLDAGRDFELREAELESRQISLVCREDFDFTVFGVEFDYALAQSVFTHLDRGPILHCLTQMQKVLRPDGKFFATFFEDVGGLHADRRLRHFPGRVVTYPSKDPFHCEFSVLADLGGRAGLEAEYVGEWGHPRAQNMVLFKRKK